MYFPGSLLCVVREEHQWQAGNMEHTVIAIG